MRWYSPFDWIPGPETEEEMEELRRLRKKSDKQSEESSAAVVTGMEIEDHLSSLLAERVFVGSNFPVLGSRYMPLAFITCNLVRLASIEFFPCLETIHVFPRFVLVTSFPATGIPCMHSRACASHSSPDFPRPALLTYFTVTRTHCTSYPLQAVACIAFPLLIPIT